MENLSIVEAPPTTSDFLHLREMMGWGQLDYAAVGKGLASSLYCVCVYQDHQLVAMGRVVGDGAIYFYIQDVMVRTAYQGQGLGHLIMDKIMTFIGTHATENSTIGLMSAKGKEGFYHKYGFISRPNEKLGAGMCIFVDRS